MKFQFDTEDRRVWRLAWPIILSNLSVPLVGMVDAGVVGHLGEPAFIGAIALGAMLFSLLYGSFSFLRMGTTGFIAQAAGAGDGDLMRRHIVRGIVAAIVIGAITLLVQGFVLRFALLALDGSARVESLTEQYFSIRVYSAPAVLVQYVAMGILIGLGNTRGVLWVQLILNATNVVLDVVFVMLLGLDVDGVAWASVIAETSATVVAIYLTLKAVSPFPGRWEADHLFVRKSWARMFEVNSNLFVRTVTVISANCLFTAIGARMGDAMLAANFILMTMVNVLSFGLDGFAHAAEVLTGEAFGRKSRRAYRAAVRASTRLAAITAFGFAIVWLLTGVLVINIMTDIEQIRQLAYQHLPWVVLTPIIAVWSYQLDGVFIGTTHTREMRNGMLVSFFCFAASCMGLLIVMGNHGLWASMMVFYVVRAYTLYRYLPRIEAAIES